MREDPLKLRLFRRHRHQIRRARVLAASLSVCAIAIGLPTTAAPGATQTWVPTTAGPFAFDDAANWNAGAGPVPGAADLADMQVDLTANQAVDLPTAKSLYQLLIGDTTQTGGVYQNQTFTGSTFTF